MSVKMVQQRSFNSMEARPRPKTLKDFLSENPSSSCSSSGFKSLPRRIITKPKTTNETTNTTTTITMHTTTTFKTLINTIRSIILVKKKKSLPSMILPRGISRRMRSQTFCKGANDVNVVSTVKIKDIMRWKSFGDANRNNQTPLSPLDLPSQSLPLDFDGFVVGSTATTTTTTCSSRSNGSSWSDSDFSASGSGYYYWDAQNDDVLGREKISLSPFVVVGKDLMEPTTKTAGSKGIPTSQEDEQYSPVSVLQTGKDEFSPFDQSLANIERKKQKSLQIQRLDSLAKLDQCLLLDENYGYDDEEVEEEDYVEERARHLLHCVKATSSIEHLDTLLLDFFREELIGIGRTCQNRNDNNEECHELEILRKAEDWAKGSFGYDDILRHVNKDACIKDMDTRCGWSKLEQEKQELALQIETSILHSLVVEILCSLKC